MCPSWDNRKDISNVLIIRDSVPLSPDKHDSRYFSVLQVNDPRLKAGACEEQA